MATSKVSEPICAAVAFNDPTARVATCPVAAVKVDTVALSEKRCEMEPEAATRVPTLMDGPENAVVAAMMPPAMELPPASYEVYCSCTAPFMSGSWYRRLAVSAVASNRAVKVPLAIAPVGPRDPVGPTAPVLPMPIGP